MRSDIKCAFNARTEDTVKYWALEWARPMEIW
jgi:hypothetical protein